MPEDEQNRTFKCDGPTWQQLQDAAQRAGMTWDAWCVKQLRAAAGVKRPAPRRAKRPRKI